MKLNVFLEISKFSFYMICKLHSLRTSHRLYTPLEPFGYRKVYMKVYRLHVQNQLAQDFATWHIINQEGR